MPTLRRLCTLCLLLALMAPGSLWAATYSLIVQPILPRAAILKGWQPLADYLSKATGDHIQLEAALNFLTYWESMRQGKYDLVLDAAHFTGYRIEKMNYTPLAKLPGTVSFALVTGPKTLIFDPSELNGQRIATLPAPGLGALRLNAMFPNPARQPMLVTVNNSEEAVEDLLAGKVKAAMIPAPLVGNYPNLNTVLTTQPVPHMALSASPKVPKAVQDKIRSALLNATKTPAGQKMLQAVHIEGFQPVSANTYAPYAKLLQDTWGY